MKTWHKKNWKNQVECQPWPLHASNVALLNGRWFY